MIDIRIEGTEIVIASIDNYDVSLRNKLKDLNKATAKAVAKEAKATAPVGKKSNLKDSIKAKYINKGLTATVAPRKPKGSHRHLVEYGTAKRSTKSGANRGEMPANPFMKRAQQSQESEYYKKVRSIVNENEII